MTNKCFVYIVTLLYNYVKLDTVVLLYRVIFFCINYNCSGNNSLNSKAKYMYERVKKGNYSGRLRIK